MSALPQKYEIDYIVYNASTSAEEELKLWTFDYLFVIKRMMMRKFDNWVESEHMKHKQEESNDNE